MVEFPILLAHGALGDYDELLFILVGIIFIGLMIVAWVRSRNSQPDVDHEQSPGEPAPPDADDPDSDARPDHFRLS